MSMEINNRACEYFDTVKDRPRPDCPQDMATSEAGACSHWMDQHVAHDVFGVCRRNGEPQTDKQTIDMFMGPPCNV